MTEISIALATYNGERFIEEQLESYSRQTVLPAELVVSDDGSTDATLEKVSAFARRAPFEVVVLPRGPRLGFSDNFLRAASACRYGLVALSDQDDVWLPKKLERALRFMEPKGVLLAMHTLLVTDAELNHQNVFRQGIQRTAVHGPLTLDPYATGWGNSMVFRRDLLGLYPAASRPRHPSPRDGRLLTHDTWLYTLAAALGRVAHIDEPLCLYRQHGTNVAGVELFSPGEQFRRRLTRMRAIPLQDYKVRSEFYGEVEDVFASLGDAASGDLQRRATAARARYSYRRAYWQARYDTYCKPTLSGRFGALLSARSLQVRSGARPIDVLSALVKDAWLGLPKHHQ